MITCNLATDLEHQWIIDSGESDHMTPYCHVRSPSEQIMSNASIKLPTKDNVMVSHIGTTQLETGLTLKKVLCVPTFKHSLLSVQRLAKDSNCRVEFYSTHCLIQDASTK